MSVLLGLKRASGFRPIKTRPASFLNGFNGFLMAFFDNKSNIYIKIFI